MQNLQKIQTARTKRRISLTKAVSITLLGVGAAALIISIVYASSVLAFIGLGLLFWGAILTYIRTEEYIREDLLDATVLPSLLTLNQILQELNYKGKPMYLPPKYFEEPEAVKIYIAKQKSSSSPTPEQIQKHENQLLVKNLQDTQGILLAPIGAELTRLFEKALETNFTKVNLEYLQQNLPKLFIESLEIAQNFEMETQNSNVLVKIENSAYKNICKDSEELSRLYDAVGCPISSAIACTLAKATGKPITIESRKTSDDGRDVEIEYRILEEE
jgi:hypothetical protein